MLKKITLLAATMLASSGAYAAHPLITDDTGTQGTGKF
ncbi:MAG: transporter, partial [Chlorobiaceae bacterium]|nr:transporter [Chlorobiaceae bacterium]